MCILAVFEKSMEFSSSEINNTGSHHTTPPSTCTSKIQPLVAFTRRVVSLTGWCTCITSITSLHSVRPPASSLGTFSANWSTRLPPSPWLLSSSCWSYFLLQSYAPASPMIVYLLGFLIHIQKRVIYTLFNYSPDIEFITAPIHVH